MSVGPFLRQNVAVFVSDLHLEPELGQHGNPSQAQDSRLGSGPIERNLLFQKFLRDLAKQPPQYLFLVGDVFDLWVGSSGIFASRFASVVALLSRLAQMGTQIHYFEGNHDFHLRDYFDQYPIAKVHSGPERFLVGTHRLLVEHGDEMDRSDTGYLFLRWFLRTAPMRFLALHLPGPVIGWLGARMSRASRKWTDYRFNQMDLDRLRSVMVEHANTKFREREFDLFVSGHTHVRSEVRLKLEGGIGVSDPHQSLDARPLNGPVAVNLGSWFGSDGSEGPMALELGPDGLRWIQILKPSVS